MYNDYIDDLENEVEVTEQELIEESQEPTSGVGIVTGCAKLNVRPDASTNGTPLCVLSEGDILIVDLENSVDGWYKVYTEVGIEGFCMKAYIEVKE